MKISTEVVKWPLRGFDQVDPLNARTVRIGEKVLVQCCSTQYLGIPWNTQAQQAISTVIAKSGPSAWGAFGSNFLGGTHEFRLHLQKEVAELTGYPAVLAFASGWAANYAIGEAIGHICDLVVSDKRSHNSVIHGLRAGKSNVLVDNLNEIAVENVVNGKSVSQLAVFTPALEGITGEHVSPTWTGRLRENSLWIRDDCHSFGALGQFGTEDFDGRRPDVRVLGFSKACGVIGAAVCGSKEFIEVLTQLASPWIFSTAIPPILWEMNRAVLRVVIGMSEERAKILALAEDFRRLLLAGGIRPKGQFHISGVPVQSEKLAQFEGTLRDLGYFIKVSQYPSRPSGSPCARVCFTPEHRYSDAVGLSEAILQILTG